MGGSAAADISSAPSPWKLLSDIVDEVIGVRGRPERLVKYINFFFLALLACSAIVHCLIPSTPQAHEAVSLSQLRFTTEKGVFQWNAFVLKNNLWAVRCLNYAFIVVVIILILLVNTVALAIVADERKKRK